MALADYFSRNVVAATQVLQGVDEAALRDRLETTPVAIGFTQSAARSPEGRALLDMTVRLLARLYPILVLRPATGADATASELAVLAQAINPRIEIGEGIEVPVGIAVGADVEGVAPATVYAGSEGWDARVSTLGPRAVGSSSNPLGAGTAACLACANVFRTVFLRDDLAAMDRDVTFSTFALDAGRVAEAPTLDGLQIDDDVVLVGLGAIGNAVTWALARTPVTGRLRLVDLEDIDLSNIQRYVLAHRTDIGRTKVTLAAEAFAGEQVAIPYPMDWAHFVEVHGYAWDRVVVALDSAADRRAVQAALPRWIANGWTQPGDLGVSTHDFRRGACLSCLYLPRQAQQNEDEVIATALRIPDRIMDVRTLLYRNASLPRDLLGIVATRFNLPVEQVVAFEGRTIRELYVEGICGGAVLPLGRAGTPRQDVHVPMAHQSALAGTLLAAALLRDGLGRTPAGTRVTRIDLMRPLGRFLSQVAQKDASSRCICQDDDYHAAYDAKYGSFMPSAGERQTSNTTAELALPGTEAAASSIGKEVTSMATGKKAGSAASKVLRDPKSSKAEKRAAASDLAQRPRRTSGKQGK